jgi:protein-S-isoprenylcysteine O-methyltransferase Ste14
MALLEEFEKQGTYLFKYRGILPLVVLLAGLGAYIENELDKIGLRDPVQIEVYGFICLFVCLIGFGIRVYTVGHTPKNTSDRNTEGQLADELNTTGIYSIVRHPLYLGNFFMWLGLAMLSENIWFTGLFVFVYWVYYERIMFAEEQFLRKEFRTAYLEWARRTPAFLPSLKNRVRPKMPFSWKKVIKKEKNGFFAIFAVFYLFQCTRNVINKADIISLNWLFYATIVSGLVYLAVKILRDFTRLLDEKDR